MRFLDLHSPEFAGEGALDKTTILEMVSQILPSSQISTAPDELYDAAADRYKKYAKARQVLDVPVPVAIVSSIRRCP